MSKLVTCPQCQGLGVEFLLVASHPEAGLYDATIRASCHVCRGHQLISRERAERIGLGIQLRRNRESRGVDVKREAARLGMPAQALRRLEAGYIDA